MSVFRRAAEVDSFDLVPQLLESITLAIGIVASMFTALYVTRTIFVALLNRGIITG